MLQTYLDKWELRAPELLIETYDGFVYKVESLHGAAVLKIYTEPGKSDGLRSIDLLKLWDGNGAIRLFANDDEAQLIEYAGSVSLMTLVTSGCDEKATEIAAGVMQKLHAAKVLNSKTFNPLAERYQSLFEPMPAETSTVFIRAKSVAERMLAEQGQPCVLHGDLHHANFLHSETRGWLTIDPRGWYGDRASDAGAFLLSPAHFGVIGKDAVRLNGHATILGDLLDLSPDRIISYAYLEACVISIWATEVGFTDLAANCLEMAQLAEACIS